jgi:hypothetical protein
MGQGQDCWGSIPGKSRIFFASPQCPALLWGPPSLPSNGYQTAALLIGVMQLGRKAEYSPPSTAEVMKGGVITPLPQ